MKTKMKFAVLCALTLPLAGCAGTFSGTTPPTTAEQAVYTIQTNYVTQVSVETNTVTVTNQVVVLQTNQVGQLVEITNVTTVPLYVTVPVTNEVAQYSYTGPSAATQKVVATTGAVISGFNPVAGSLFTGLAGLLITGVGWLLSAKSGTAQGTAASTMAQEIEMLLEFLKTVPNGTAYTTALTAWLQSHQVTAGAAQTILTILENDVSNPDAKAAVAEVLASINAVNASIVPITQVQTAQAAAAAAK